MTLNLEWNLGRLKGFGIKNHDMFGEYAGIYGYLGDIKFQLCIVIKNNNTDIKIYLKVMTLKDLKINSIELDYKTVVSMLNKNIVKRRRKMFQFPCDSHQCLPGNTRFNGNDIYNSDLSNININCYISVHKIYDINDDIIEMSL